MSDDDVTWMEVVDGEPSWIKALFFVLLIILMISEYLPFTRRANGNGISHQLLVLYQNSLRNIITGEEKKNED